MTSLKSTIKSIVPPQYVPVMTDTYYSLRSVLHRGQNLTCPCCGGSFSKFLPYGNRQNPQPNSQCPRCGTVERHRILWLYLQNKTNIFQEELKVLHIAAEYWLQKQFKKMRNLEYITADLYDNLAMVKMDITDIKFPDNSFDVILCNHVLEHIPNEQKAMSELLRVLKPNGWAILQVPLDNRLEVTFEDPSVESPEERERLFGQSDHVRAYGQDYKARLEKAKFNVKVENYIGELSSELVAKYKLEEEWHKYMATDIYLCTKSGQVLN